MESFSVGRWVTKRRVCSSMPKKERTVLKPSIFLRPSGIPKLEAEDLMELRLLWHSLEH